MNEETKAPEQQNLTTALGDELTAVLRAHAVLCKTAVERAGAESEAAQVLTAAISDGDFIMRQYLAYIRTFVEPVVARSAMARAAAEAAVAAAKAGQEVDKAEKPQWPPAGFEKKA